MCRKFAAFSTWGAKLSCLFISFMIIRSSELTLFSISFDLSGNFMGCVCVVLCVLMY